jgi:hypothetical protein
MQEVDADRRLQLLRGERLDPLPLEAEHDTSHKRKREDGSPHRKKGRLAGEDDTDRDMRLAREAAAVPIANFRKAKGHDAPLVDHKGHISLFPEEHRHAEKNPEAESETAKKKREFEDQYTMRFSNAAGFKQKLENPWYAGTISSGITLQNTPGKDVWGNEDPRRQEREQKRLDSSDPLAAIKLGVKKVRLADRHRKEWMEERERDLTEVEEMARENRRRRRRKDHDSDSLEGFSLEAGYEEKRREGRKHRSGRREESRHERHSQRDRHGQRTTGSNHHSHIPAYERSIEARSRSGT